jgi:tRNA(Ile)-lysidine synthase TilS/MesJ
MMCFSGGKDSTYTLSILKRKYGLNILAFTCDNGFMAEQTRENIRNAVESLGIDHYLFKPRQDILKKIFQFCSRKNPYSAQVIERASVICTSCMGIIKYSALRLAIEKNIPMVAFGWSPGQTSITAAMIRYNPEMIRKMQAAIYDRLLEIAGREIDAYFLDEGKLASPYFPWFVHPLAFLDYDEKEIYRVIRDLGWIKPEDVDPNSTNCILNTFANAVHKAQFGFNPYVFELASLVRQGMLDRAEALKRLDEPECLSVISKVKSKLGITGGP